MLGTCPISLLLAAGSHSDRGHVVNVVHVVVCSLLNALYHRRDEEVEEEMRKLKKSKKKEDCRRLR